MASASLRFYTHGRCGEHSYVEVSKKLVCDPKWPLALAKDPKLLDIVLPYTTATDTVAQATLGRLATEPEPGKRYHAIVMLLLHRLDFELDNPQTGSFKQSTTEFRSVTQAGTFIPPAQPGAAAVSNCDGLVTGSGEEWQAYRGVLKRIVSSMAWCGLLHYSRQISVRLLQLCLTIRTGKADIMGWAKSCTEVLRDPLMVYCTKNANYQTTLFPVYLRGISHFGPSAVPPLKGITVAGRSEEFTVCKHGVFKVNKTLNNVRQMTCLFIETPNDCGDRQLIT